MSADGRSVRYQAHRGAVDEAPENTMPAFRHAWRYPGAIPETDVRVTADGVLVCVHDATLARTTDAPPAVASRPLAEMTLAEVQSVDAGVRFGKAFRGERVPTLDELLAEMAKEPHRQLFVEPKAVELPVLRAKLEEYGVTGRVLFVSGYAEVLADLQRVFPGAPAMTWVGGPAELIRERVGRWLEAGAQDVSILQLHLQVVEPGPDPVYALDDEYLAQAQRRLADVGVELQLRPFVVTADALRRFLQLGVRWYVTDGPAAFWRELATALRPAGQCVNGEPIYHIARSEDWSAALAVGEYRAASLESEGFIHCSTRDQLLRVANAFFDPGADLVVLRIDSAALEDRLRFEAPARSGDALAHEQFPHVYGALPLPAVVALDVLHASSDQGFLWPKHLL